MSNFKENKIFISQAIYQELIQCCLKDPDKEACGILAGKNRKIEKIFPLANISESPKLCYHIDAKEQLTIFKELRKQALEMVAIYHSHVDSQAYPSQKDIELAFYPDSSYIIISLSSPGQPQARSFKIVEGKIEEEELEIVDG